MSTHGVSVNGYDGDDERPALLIPEYLPQLDEWLKGSGARIVVLDPIVAMIPVTLNAHRDQHVRRALAPIARIERWAAFVCVMHLNKDARPTRSTA